MNRSSKNYSLFSSKNNETEKITGEIAKIRFHNEDNGFTVADFQVDNEKTKITVVGNLMEPHEGDWLKITGIWVKNPKFGMQFKILSWKIASPSTKEGIIKFLSSGMIKGVGKSTAERLVDYFGLSVLDIMADHPERLTELPGIGKIKAAQISNSFAKHRDLSEIVVFLQSYGVGPNTAVKIYSRYKKDTITLIRENPYRLADEIHGIGFHTADKIAETMGFPSNSPLRLKSAMLFALRRASEQEGHVYLTETELISATINLLGESDFDFPDIINELSVEKRIIIDSDAVYLPRAYYAENGLARNIAVLTRTPGIFNSVSENELLKNISGVTEINLAKTQIKAVLSALKNKFTVITGGPGTGKTTLIKTIVSLLSKRGKTVLLAAPTGRAAKRLHEATDTEAKTIHRLLDYQPATSKFMRNEHNKLSCDFLIIDETSMVDLRLMHALIGAVPENAGVVLVGDADQLPSVGAGAVLAELIKSGRIPVVRLTEIFRQAGESVIVRCAHAVNKGENISPGKGGKGDLFFIERDNPEDITEVIKEMISERIRKNYGFSPLTDVQVLTPMHKGIIGTENLNEMLREAFNSEGERFTALGKEWRVGDKILQIKNNYDLDIFNGDTGFITAYDRKNDKVIITIDGRDIERSVSELSEIAPAYAISIHKSQGSEYPAVIIPVHTQHAIMLQRNLLYTGITRAKRLVLLIGSRKALNMAIKNNRQQHRNTKLSERIREYLYE